MRIKTELGLVLTVLTGVIPQVTLGIINALTLRQIDPFTVVILLVILYGLTLGKKDLKRIDRWAQNRFGRSNGEEKE